MVDLLLVGAGITSASLAACLKHHMTVAVLDTRPNLGGNCHDFLHQGTRIHTYGPHIFHSPSHRVTEFLSRYTHWTPYTHTVTARIDWDDRDRAPRTASSPPSGLGGQSVESSPRLVPFPYSQTTIAALGRQLSHEELLRLFFRGYSQKMWGRPWDELPNSIRNRVPKPLDNPPPQPQYYNDQFAALPSKGYTHMLENMFDGTTLHLGVPPDEWTRVRAKTIVYTGRPDLIPDIPDRSTTVAQTLSRQSLKAGRKCAEMPFRTLDIAHSEEPWPYQSTCLHDCTDKVPWTRKTSYKAMNGGSSALIFTETPRDASPRELTPFYPIETPQLRARHSELASAIRRRYPHLHLAGRLGTYRYLDMYQAVGQALALAARLLN